MSRVRRLPFSSLFLHGLHKQTATVRVKNAGIRFPRLYDLLSTYVTRGRERKYRQDLVELVGIRPGHRVLDVGCGTGSFAIAAWSRTQPGGSVGCVDVSPEMLRVARQKNRKAGSAVEFFNAEATNLPFQDGTFDVVTMITVLHAIPRAARRAFLAEMTRLLRPAGLVVLVDFAGDVKQREHWIARHGDHGKFDLHDFPLQPGEHGLRVVESGNLGWMDLGYIKSQKAALSAAAGSA